MAKKPATKTPAKPTRTTQDAPKAPSQAKAPAFPSNRPQDEMATSADSTGESPAAVSEPAFPDLHSVSDSEHGQLHRLQVAAYDDDDPAGAVAAISTDLNHPVVQKYQAALLEWLAS